MVIWILYKFLVVLTIVLSGHYLLDMMRKGPGSIAVWLLVIMIFQVGLIEAGVQARGPSTKDALFFIHLAFATTYFFGLFALILKFSSAALYATATSWAGMSTLGLWMLFTRF
jgi:hypothetical protein